MAAPLANANNTWLADILKEVQLLYANVTQAIAARNAPVDRGGPFVWNSVEIATIDANTLSLRKEILFELTHLSGGKQIEVVGRK